MCVALTGFTRWLHRYGFMGPQKRKSKSKNNRNSNSRRYSQHPCIPIQ